MKGLGFVRLGFIGSRGEGFRVASSSRVVSRKWKVNPYGRTYILNPKP